MKSLGDPVITSRQWTTALSPNSGGTDWNYIVSSWDGDPDPVEWVVLKNFTGSHVTQSIYNAPNHTYANTLFQYYNQIRAQNGRIFFPCFGNYTAYYDPTTEAVSVLGPVVEVPPVDPNASTIFYSAVFDVSGQLYFGTQESQNRPAAIVRTNPTTLSQSLLGYVGTGALGYTTYAYYIAPDTATATKYIYVAYGQDPWQLWALNINTSSGTLLYPSTANGHISFTDIPMSGWVATIDTDLGQGDNVHTQWWCLDGAIYPYTASVAPPVAKRNVTPASATLVNPPDIDILGGIKFVEWRPNGSTGSFTVVNYTVVHTASAVIESLVETPDGVLGNTAQYQGFFRTVGTSSVWYGAEQNLGISQGPRVSIVADGVRRIFMAGYPNGVSYFYDPSKAWQEDTSPTINPSLLGYFGLSGIFYAGIKYADYLIWTAGAGTKGRLYCAGVRERNGAGAGIGYWDSGSLTFSGTYAAPLDVVTPSGLASLDSIGRVVMSTALLNPPGNAPIYVFDQNLNTVSTQVPLALADVGQIYATGTPSVICGLANRSGTLTIYQHNVQSNSLVGWDVTSYAGYAEVSVTNPADRSIWAAVTGALIRIDPDTRQITTQIDTSVLPSVDCMSFHGSVLYLSSGASLYSIDFGGSPQGGVIGRLQKKNKLYQPRRGMRFSNEP